MSMSIRKQAREVHNIAETAGHDLVWHTITNGYEGKCIHPNCKIVVSVTEDGSDTLTLEQPIPSCPLNTQQ